MAMSGEYPLTRRQILRTAQGAAALALAAPTNGNALIRPKRKIPYGAAVGLEDLRTDPQLGRAIAETCGLIVPVTELKWSDLRPAPGQFAFEKADAIAAFAADNGLGMRGHTLVWYAAMPDWTSQIDSEAAAERALREHIETVVARYRGRIHSWDVVNEVIPDVVDQVTDRRPSLWSRHLGERYIPLAFRIAAEVDPNAQLVLNEYDVEFADERCRSKRAAFRNLILQLQDANVKISSIGLQCHLRGEIPIDSAGLEAFVAEMRTIGLTCLVTELDVMDQHLPRPEGVRDALIAAQVHDLLNAVSAPGPLDAVLTWGITDRHSWIPYAVPRSDGAANRPLPLDREFRRKPFMDVIDQFTGRVR